MSDEVEVGFVPERDNEHEKIKELPRQYHVAGQITILEDPETGDVKYHMAQFDRPSGGKSGGDSEAQSRKAQRIFDDLCRHAQQHLDGAEIDPLDTVTDAAKGERDE